MPQTTGSIASTNAAMVTIDRDLRICDWPASAVEWTGWPADELVGRAIADVLDSTVDGAPTALRQWVPGRFAASLRCQRAMPVRVQADFQPLAATGARCLGVVHLQPVPAVGCETESRYESVIAAMQEGVTVIDLDGRITACNRAAERILGLPAAQLCGLTPIDPRWRAVMDDGSPFPGDLMPAMVTLRTGQPQTGIVMGVHQPSGGMTWIRIDSQPIRARADLPHHAVVATFSDITEERALIDEAQARAGQLELVVATANDGFWDWHVRSGHVTFSSRWATMLGYRLEELATDLSTWSRLVHPEDMPKVDEVLQAHLRGETAFYETEHRMLAKDGRWVWILDRGKVIERDAAGRAVRAVGTHTDITRARAAEEQLRRVLAQVRRLGELLPLCGRCGCWRAEAELRPQVEAQLAAMGDAPLARGLCDSCGSAAAD